MTDAASQEIAAAAGTSRPAAGGNVHIVRVQPGLKSTFSSPTLAPDHLDELQTVFRNTPWYSDGYTHKRFRSATRRIFETFPERGLAFVGTSVKIDIPPPFSKRFEPVELGSGDTQLGTLSGKPRKRRVSGTTQAVIFFVLLAAFTIGMMFLRGRVFRVALLIAGIFAATSILVALIIMLQRSAGAWYLVPGGVAITRRFQKGAKRLVVLTRYDSWVVMRWISNGKTSVLMLEIFGTDGTRFRKGINYPDAESFFGAWQCPHPPPSREMLAELVCNSH